jgi:DNA-binding NarL/FixJ family response regulator
LTRVGWGRSNPAFRRVFTTLYMPDASPSEVAAFEEVQRLSCSAETAARIRQASYHVDVTDLAKRVAVPTLVLHARDDASVPVEEGRRLAALIPGAAFVPLEGRNHVLMPSEPAWNQFVTEVKRFVAEPVRTPQPRLPSLSRREQEVLRLVAEGMDNDAIAQRLSLSTRTVERHLSHAYAKLGVSGKAARAAAAVRFARAL